MENKSSSSSCSCSSSATNCLILACSGASNVGQLTNEAAKQLDIQGDGRFYCLAGVGAQLDTFIANARGVDKLLVLDGCSTACAKKVMFNTGIREYDYLVVTELGVEKNHGFTLNMEDLKKVIITSQQKLTQI